MSSQAVLICVGDLQFGFRPGHSTQDAIFLLSHLIKKCKRSQKAYHAIFIDLQKVKKSHGLMLVPWRSPFQAYDSMSQGGLYKKLQHLGLGGKVLSLIRSMYHVSFIHCTYMCIAIVLVVVSEWLSSIPHSREIFCGTLPFAGVTSRYH